MRTSVEAFPDLTFSDPGRAGDRRRLTGRLRSLADDRNQQRPDRSARLRRHREADLEVKGFDVWQFRDGLIWRYEAIYDFSQLARQLGLFPPRGGFAERALVGAQRLRSKLPL